MNLPGQIAVNTGIRPVLNDSGEDIPPHAAMRLSGTNTDYGVQTVEKPDEDSQTQNIVFNGPTIIEAGGYGTAYLNFPLTALGHPDDDEPVAGDDWGTEADEWKLRKDNTGFKAIGNVLTNSFGHYMQVDRVASAGTGWEHVAVLGSSGDESILSTPQELFNTGVLEAGTYMLLGRVQVDHDVTENGLSPLTDGLHFIQHWAEVDVTDLGGGGPIAVPVAYYETGITILKKPADSGDSGVRNAYMLFTIASHVTITAGNGIKVALQTSNSTSIGTVAGGVVSEGASYSVDWELHLWRLR